MNNKDIELSKSAQFKNILNGDHAEMILEAHNGLSAKIAEKAGFKAIWASGLSISASLGLRDCNEASWSQILEVTEFMNDSVKVPILFDCDSGFGNYNNVRHIVRKLSSYGVAGISLEDKIFPKMNSFIKGAHSLVSIEEFEGKIKAAQDSKLDDDFVVIARTEALISGLDVNEALRRAERYHAAGADAIFIHSKETTADQILEFARRWDKRSPLVVAPTTYSHISPEELNDVGVTTYICANHMMRASLKAMLQVAMSIKQQNSIHNINHQVASLSDVFDLLNYDELEDAEILYTPIG
jgi:phosphoenolpyruvate mutase